MPALPFPHPPLADEAVLLRPWTARDVPDNVMKFADPLIQLHAWPQARPYTASDASQFLAVQEEERLLGVAVSLAFAEPADPGRVLGGGSLYDVDLGAGRAAVGYWLAREARGRGVATRATRMLARWGFLGLGLERVELTCGPANEASQRVALRCGFTREALLRSHMCFQGRRRDSIMFSLLRGELA